MDNIFSRIIHFCQAEPLFVGYIFVRWLVEEAVVNGKASKDIAFTMLSTNKSKHLSW